MKLLFRQMVVLLTMLTAIACENDIAQAVVDTDIVFLSPGSACKCDIECQGDLLHPGVCYYGVCMQGATGRCVTEGSAENCPDGMGCLSAPQCAAYDVCTPRYLEATCAGYENKYRLCTPGRFNEADARCSACAQPYRCSAATGSNTPQTAGIFDPAVPQNERELCTGEEHWYRMTVPSGVVVKGGIEYFNKRGDIDLLVHDGQLGFLGSRLCRGAGGSCVIEPYPHPSVREYETDAELFGFYDPAGMATYFFKVVGYNGAENRYRLSAKLYPYTDGADCLGLGFTEEECYGAGFDGTDLLPFPFDITGGAYFFQNHANYRFAARELLMYVRNAIFKTMAAFPGTAPLGVGMSGQTDGRSPRYDISHDAPGRFNHIHGRAMDIAYYQQNGDNRYREVCGTAGWGTDLICNPDAVNTHLIDLERQIFFIAQLTASGRMSAVLTDRTLLPLLQEAAYTLAALPQDDPRHIEPALADQLNDGTSLFDYPNHHHHIHIGLPWSEPVDGTTAP